MNADVKPVKIMAFTEISQKMSDATMLGYGLL